jgi:membrane dipeptidase
MCSPLTTLALRYASLGARYLTLTHTCHNAFGDSCTPSEPLHSGLSTFGHDLISELNRLGVLVDVSHTSNSTASDAILASRAPVIFSHSSSKALFDHPRNVEDSVLRLFSEPNPNWKGHGRGTERGAAWKERDGLVAATAVPAFIGLNGTVEDVADHIEHLASVVGKHRVGLGTDFDGYREDPPKGLEDVSMYPKLVSD